MYFWRTTFEYLERWRGKVKVIEIAVRWNCIENKCHIHSFELHVASSCLKAFCKNEIRLHVLLKLDNTTAIAYINKKWEPFKPHITNLRTTFATGSKSKIFGSPQFVYLRLTILLLISGHAFFTIKKICL